MDLLSRASEPAYPLPPSALPEAPRPTEFTLLSRVYRGMALASLLIAPNVVLFLGNAYYVQRYRDLANEGQRADAVVTERSITRGRRGASDYWVAYRYQANGRSFEQRSSVSFDDYQKMPEHTNLAITYMPHDPANHCVGQPAENIERTIRDVLIFSTIVAVVLAVWFLWQHISMNRELYLARNGIAVVGRVTNKDQTRYRNSISYWVNYAFEPEGRPTLSGKTTLSKDVWDYLCYGLPVTVLYLPDNPGRFQLLCGFKHISFLRERSDDAVNDLSVEAAQGDVTD
jgi:hypothetical protein